MSLVGGLGHVVQNITHAFLVSPSSSRRMAVVGVDMEVKRVR